MQVSVVNEAPAHKRFIFFYTPGGYIINKKLVFLKNLFVKTVFFFYSRISVKNAVFHNTYSKKLSKNSEFYQKTRFFINNTPLFFATTFKLLNKSEPVCTLLETGLNQSYFNIKTLISVINIIVENYFLTTQCVLHSL